MSTARIALFALVALVAGVIAGYILVSMVIFGAWALMGVHDRDGGGAMAVGFVIAPAGAVVFGLASAIATVVILSKRRATAPAPEPESAARDTRLFIRVTCAVAGFALGWLVADLVRALIYSLAYRHYVASLIFSLTHMVLPLAFAIIGFFLPRLRTKNPG